MDGYSLPALALIASKVSNLSILDQLIQHPSWVIRSYLAENKFLSNHHIQILAHDNEKFVVYSLFKNKNFTNDQIDDFLNNPTINILYALHKTYPLKVLNSHFFQEQILFNSDNQTIKSIFYYFRFEKLL